MAVKDLTALRTALGDWLDVDTTRLSNSIRDDSLNIVMRRLLRKYDLWFGETSDTFATVDGTRDYAKPTGWSRPFSVWYTDPDTSAVVFLDRINKDEFDARFPDSTKKAKPTHYTVWGTNLQLGKTPDQVITINRNYYKILDDLSASNLSNDFTTNAWEVLLFGALVEITEFLIEDARRPMWVRKFEGFESDLQAEHRREHSAGRIPQSKEPS